MPAKKTPGTYRIFIMGESAALGDPEPAFGAGRYLEVLLREKFPGEKFEVINVAMTAINSHAILPIARDCARQNGDLWIIYTGNNEMVGPFGAATVFGAQAPPWPLVRLNLALQKFRLGQLLVDVGRKLKGKETGREAWGGMKMFSGNLVPPNDPRKQTIYRNFDKNLRDILRAGLDSGAQVLLSTVAMNLKDCPPFGSQINDGISARDRDQVDQLMTAGNSLAEHGDWAGAVKSYEQADQFKPQSADLDFRLGNSLWRLVNRPAARLHFEQALDLDCLPFRADTHINTLISKAGSDLSSPQLTLFDATAALENNPPNDILGRENFYEHVHLNFDGNYRLALAWAGQVAKYLPSSITKSADAAWASQETCEQRLGLTDWERGNVLAEVCRRMQQPPLNSQFNNEQRLGVLSKQEAEIRKQRNAAAARQIYVEALQRTPDDYYILENYAYFLTDTGDVDGAIVQWHKVSTIIPQDHVSFFELGRLAGRQGKYDEAQILLGQALAIHPSFAPGWFELGKVRAASGNYELALQAFSESLRFNPQDAPSWFCSGLALAMLNRRADAIQYYHQAVKFAPDDWMTHFELGGLLGLDGKMSEAKTESEMAIRLNPDFPRAHLNLGMALVQLGQFAEAEQQFKETLRLDPTNSKAADYLNQTRALQKNKP